MGTLEANYYIGKEGRRVVDRYLEDKGKEIRNASESTPHFAEGLYLNQLSEAWNSALENFRGGKLFGIKVSKRAITALECNTQGVQMLSDEAEPVVRRHWTASVPGATDSVDIMVYGHEVSDVGDNPLTIRMNHDTYGISDRLNLSKHGTFHPGPEGEVSITRHVGVEREDYRAIMLETTVGELHIWQDLFGDLQEVVGNPTRVNVYDSDEFNIDVQSGVAVEVGSDKRGIISEVALEQAKKVSENSTFRKD